MGIVHVFQSSIKKRTILHNLVVIVCVQSHALYT